MLNLRLNKKSILLVTSKKDLAADIIILELKKREASFLRLNSEDFPAKKYISWSPELNSAIIYIEGEDIPFSIFRSVWYRRMVSPELPHYVNSRGLKNFIFKEVEAFLDGLWFTGEYFWINRPSNIKIAENKLIQLSVAKDIGFQIPKTVVTNNPQVVRQSLYTNFRTIAKAIASTKIEINEDTWGVYTQEISSNIICDNEIQISPIIIQERIDKKAELRITVVGNYLFATEILLEGPENNKSDWHLVDNHFIAYRKHELPEKIANLCMLMARKFGLIYAALDFIITPKNEYVFLEINPSGQWGWIEKETGYPITNTLVDCLMLGEI